MKMHEKKLCRVYGTDWTKLVLSPYAQAFYGSTDPMTILEHETDDGTCEYKVLGLWPTIGWLRGEEELLRHIEGLAIDSYLELAKNHHWTCDILIFACKYYGCSVPENAAEIVEEANKMIDDFAVGGYWCEESEVMTFSAVLLELYCTKGSLDAVCE